jgi:hypothetical protein
VLADPVGEYVDEIGDIRHTIFDQPRRELLGVEGFGERRRERQDFDPKPWLNRVEGLEARKHRDRHHEVAPRVTDKAFDLALVIAFARPAKPILKQIVRL